MRLLRESAILLMDLVSPRPRHELMMQVAWLRDLAHTTAEALQGSRSE